MSLINALIMATLTPPILKLFVTKRVVDENVIDLTSESPDNSIDDEEYFE